jgi:hypothetical protein
MDRYKDANNEIVTIFSEDVNFYTLSNGVKMKKELFERKFTKVDNNIVDANNFLNQQTPLNVINKNKQPQQQMNETQVINTGTEVIDPIDFLNSTSIPNANQLINELNTIDTNKVVDVPDSMRQTIIRRDADSNIVDDDPVSIEQKKKMLIQEYNRSALASGAPPIKPNFVDENDEKAIDRFLQQGQAPVKQKTLNENGLTEAQERVRQEQIAISGIDPFADKISEFKKNKQQENTQQIANQTIGLDLTKQNSTIIETTSQNLSTEDESYKFFKNFKRNFDVDLNIKISEKIADPEFLRLMSNNFEADILKFYSKEILKNILSDITAFEDNIYKQLHKIVFSTAKKTEKPAEIKPTRKSSKKNVVK